MDSYSVVTSGLQEPGTPEGPDGCTCAPMSFCTSHGDDRRPDAPGGPAVLNKPERRWVEAELAAGRTSADASRLHRAASKLQEHVASTVAAIANRTPTNPPPKGSGLTGMPRGSEPSDPALWDIESTYEAVDLALTRLGHLFEDCPACDGSRGHNDDWPTGAMLSGIESVKVVDNERRVLNVELSELSDQMTSLSCTSPKVVSLWLAITAQAIVKVSDRIVDDWHQARNSGAESDDLRQRVQDLADLCTRARSLRRSVAQWAPSEYQDRRGCKSCGGRVDDLPDTSHPRGGATCGPCRNAKWRDKQAG